MGYGDPQQATKSQLLLPNKKTTVLGLTLNKTTACKQRNPANLLTDTVYADDLLSNTFKDVQEFLMIKCKYHGFRSCLTNLLLSRRNYKPY